MVVPRWSSSCSGDAHCTDLPGPQAPDQDASFSELDASEEAMTARANKGDSWCAGVSDPSDSPGLNTVCEADRAVSSRNQPAEPSNRLSSGAAGDLETRPSTRREGSAPGGPRMPVKWQRGDTIGTGSFGSVFLGLNNQTGEGCSRLSGNDGGFPILCPA